MNTRIRDLIKKTVSFRDLDEKESFSVFNAVMKGMCTPAQIAALITSLRMKGETVDEITGAALAMRKNALKAGLSGKGLLDTCGTGGSGIDTFNISTAAAFVIAGCGVKVAKHGNRSASSRCGSADVLEELGVRIDVSPGTVRRCVREAGIGFFFAPAFHKAMRYAAAPRREIGVRTIFNILGPLSHPASAEFQVIGVYDASLTEVMARVLGRLGTKRAFVVHGMDGLDEVTFTTKTRISELKGGRIRTYYVTPSDFGMKKGRLEKIKGGTASSSAGSVFSVLKGAEGPARDIVLMNAAVGLMAAGKAGDPGEGVAFAAGSIDSGGGLAALKRLIKITANRGKGKKRTK